MENCLFCKIVKKEIPSNIVYEDEEVLAFLDIFPFEKGHTLIIPKNHYENLVDIPEDLYLKIMKIAKDLAQKYEQKLNNCGFNLVNNTKKIAGQEIMHFHVHLIPRRENKSLFNFNLKSNYQENEAQEVANFLKN